MKTINVKDWAQDEHSGIFPIGARDKQMLWAPEKSQKPIKSGTPYLFKESIRSYPDQFWAEIVAYIVGKHLKVDVPVALPAITKIDEEIVPGVLIEWMYQPDNGNKSDEVEKLIHAGDYFKQIFPEFDTKSGKHHNLNDTILLLKIFAQHKVIAPDYWNWLSDMALFDALIGNTDRHQENWGFIFDKDGGRLSPLYDNGTGLGHERFTDKIATWNDDTFHRYLNKGLHHLRKNRENTHDRFILFELVAFIAGNKELEKRMLNALTTIDLKCMLTEIEELTQVDNPTPFTAERFAWIKRIITTRYDILRDILES
ncbi:HipA domain-containing protein [Vibrio neonatus]|uniref:HipA domain-containing protein n=1 Tax=Vibrio neonatus TaxID=278860 RepID=UPI0021C3251E|nr:HipA domain-containing protein [Vibrio neonatus]